MPKEWIVIDTLAHPYFNWLLQNTLSFFYLFLKETHVVSDYSFSNEIKAELGFSNEITSSLAPRPLRPLKLRLVSKLERKQKSSFLEMFYKIS
jgi:hypothetical protein